MKYFSTLFLASLISVAIAQESDQLPGRKDGKVKKNLTSDQNACLRIWNVGRAQRVSSNSTRMDMISSKDPGRAHRIKEIATREGPEVSRLRQNKTLTEFCSVYQASEKQKTQCWHVKNLDKLERRIKDNIAVDDAAKFHYATSDEIKTRWQHDIDVAKRQKSNKTFTETCTKLKEAKQSKESGKNESSASTIGSSVFAVIVAGLFAGLMM